MSPPTPCRSHSATSSNGYLIAERRATTILRDPFTNKPFVNFYATKRIGGQVLDSDAIKLLKIAALSRRLRAELPSPGGAPRVRDAPPSPAAGAPPFPPIRRPP